MPRLFAIALFAALGLHAQTTAQLTPVPNIQFFDCSTGACVPAAGGSLFSYVAGTNNPLATCATSAAPGGTCTTPNANPVVLNSSGFNAAGSGNAGVWLLPRCYKFVLLNASGMTIWTQDNVCNQIGLLALGGGAGLVGFSQTGSNVGTAAQLFNSTYIWDFLYTTLAEACTQAAAAGKQVALTQLWPNITGTFNCTMAGFQGGILQPAAAATVKVGTFFDLSWTRHVDLSNAGGAQVQFGSGGYVTMETWGAVGDGVTDDGPACSNAYASLTLTPHTMLFMRPAITYAMNDCHVMPYVHLQGNDATIIKTGAGTNGVLYTTGGVNPEVIMENVTIIGNPAVVEDCFHLVGVQSNGYLMNVTGDRCGSNGAFITANRYAIRHSVFDGNGVHQIDISGSNDVTLDDDEADSSDGVNTGTGDLIAVSSGYNFVTSGDIHCEIKANVACINLTSSINNTLGHITTYYLQTLTSPAVVSLNGTTANTSIAAIAALVQAGTVTVTNLVADNVTGAFSLPGATATGFAVLAWQPNYTEGSTYSGGFSTNGRASFQQTAEGTSAAPAISGCAATIDSHSTNQSGFFTSGTTGTCTVSLTWAGGEAYSHMGPVCFGYDVDHGALFTVGGTLPTTTTTNLTGTSTSGDRIAYTCAFGN